jgi:hypothetical protein
MKEKSPRARAVVGLSSCLALAACASTSHIIAFQEAPLTAAPRTLALDHEEALPFGIEPNRVLAAATRAGYRSDGEHPRYRLAVSAAAGSPNSGSYLPHGDDEHLHTWIARPDHSLRARFAHGSVLRVNAVLIDLENDREVWRGTGTLHTSRPEAAASELTDEVLAQLPRGQ